MLTLLKDNKRRLGRRPITVNLKAIAKVYFGLNIDQICLLCGSRSPLPVCLPCQALLAAPNSALCRCGLPLPGQPAAAGNDPAPLCGRCVRRPPPFSSSRAALLYGFPVDRLINRYKHRGNLAWEHFFDQLLTRHPLPWPACDALCPLPAHWQRRWHRGFDQSERLATLLSAHWQRPLLPALRRQQATRHQQGLSRIQRQRNLRNAFLCVLPLQGQHLVLIDDVMTTGSSARAASRCLLDAGAARVDVWTLARTPRAP